MESYKDTHLWKRSLGIEDDNPYLEEIKDLRTEYTKFRNKAAILVSRISSILPGLTQHEVSHLDALWDTASLIVGENYPINPLEGFILGGAILIHDSALCFEAYENGKDGIRETLQWKDAYSEISKNNKLSGETLKSQADFSALRELHAIQAESLLLKSWKDPDNGEEIFLLDNSSLRKHLGKLIGQIAASHHWNIEEVSARLPSQQNALSEFPREWRIDPIKIACILRCADASHIDNLRAPDFLHALLKRSGISFNHWQAQNRIAKVDIDQSDPKKETLLFTSTLDFTENEADSWFVAYDAICLVDKEIKSSNAVLSNRDPNLSFQVKKIKGIESPESLSKYIRADNWKPCSAQVHVGNIEKLINNIGGEMLYGSGADLIEIVIRELIQNSRDALIARSFIEEEFEGKIKIKVERKGDDFYIIVEDNGIGMSERVLTGPLLDFGTSFWSSNLIKSEFPGLRSSSFKSVGKFGIGFYSIFMIADSVSVSSRNWNDGMGEIHTLKFKNGFTLRPILKKGVVDGFQSSLSTQISLKLKPDLIPVDLMMEIQTNRAGSANFHVPFPQYLSALCAGLDVSVFFSTDTVKEVQIHENIMSTTFNKEKWINDISFSKFNVCSLSEEYISYNIDRIKPIIDKGKIIGLAAISTKLSNIPDYLSISTVGGLAHTVHGRDGSRFIGFIDHSPKSAKREVGKFSGNEDVLKHWAEEQLIELKQMSLNSFEKYNASSALCYFKVDPTELVEILISKDKQQSFYTLEELADLSLEIGIAFLESSIGGFMATFHRIETLKGYALVNPISNGSFISLQLDTEDKPINNNSMIDCLYRMILKKGFEFKLSRLENVGLDSFNLNVGAIIISSNKKN